ncbi:peptidylprolyl isomerase [Paenibacillus yanchengensis]
MSNNNSQSHDDSQNKEAATDEHLIETESEAVSTSEEATSQLSEVAPVSDDINEPKETMVASTFGNGAGNEPPAKKGNPFWMISTLILLVALIIVLIKPPFGMKDETVAKVNGTTIQKSELYDTMEMLVGPSLLDSMIRDELLVQHMKASSIAFSDQDINDELNALKVAYGGEENYKNQLAMMGMDEEMLKYNIRQQAMIRKIHEPNAKIEEEQIKQFYDNYIANTWQVKASHILVETEQEAKDILKQLQAGADFAELAKEKGTDGTKDTGGDLGFFGKGNMIAEFEEAALALKVGELSDVVKTEFGYHIIKKTDEKLAATLEESKDAIRILLIGEDASANPEVANLTTELMNKAKITNSLAPEPVASEEPTSEETVSEKPTSETPASDEPAADNEAKPAE